VRIKKTSAVIIDQHRVRNGITCLKDVVSINMMRNEKTFQNILLEMGKRFAKK
jgi:hypothetical protein